MLIACGYLFCYEYLLFALHLFYGTWFAIACIMYLSLFVENRNLNTYRDSHYNDKMVSQQVYL